VWSSSADAGRKRRPTDVLLLAGSILILLGLAVVAPGPTGLDTSLATLLEALPSVFGLLWGVSYTALTLWALVLLLLPLAFHHRRRLSLVLVLAAAVALSGSIAAGVVAGTEPMGTINALIGIPDAPVYLAVRVALATAIIVTASPHVSRPLRYWGRVLLLLGAVSAVALSIAWPIGALAGFIVGIGAAAVTHLVFGSPQGLLTAEQVEIGLADLGIEAFEATDVADETAGEALWRAHRPGEPDLLVKVYGRDAWDSQVVGSLWTTLTRRGEMPHLTRGRQARVEHEALATMLAERAGAVVLPLVAVGRSGQGDALIATLAPRAVLAGLAADDVDDVMLDGAWHSVLALHDAGMAHGRIDGRHVVVRPDGATALADFADAELNADEGDQQVDRARLLVTTATVVGTERALAAVVRAVGTDGLVNLMPYLQPAALGRVTRQQVRDAEWSLDDIVKMAVTTIGVEAPPLQRINRVSLKSVAIVVFVALLAYTLVGALSGVDPSSIVDAMSSANVLILLIALVCSPFIQAALAFSTLGATLTKLTYVPVLMLQYAIQFIALCLPSTAARLALEVRFFERYGIAAAPAVTMGMIDSFSGFTVQIALIILILVSGLPGFTYQVLGSSSSTDSTSTSSDPSLIVIVAVLTVVALIVTLAVPTLRHRLVGSIPRIRTSVTEQRRKAGDAFLVLRNPRKVATMLLGNLGAQVIQAIILGITLAAFGETAHLSQLILINTAVSLFAGLMPVPGGMGVSEAGYTAGLQAIGIPAPIAMSTAISFRLVTFYLPPLWGSVAMRWLRRHSFI
jgi:uncharacterized membrane protein YbhN (UPF0104 family)